MMGGSYSGGGMMGTHGGGMMSGGSGYGAGMMGAGPATRSSSATLLIRHQVKHCHAWSLNGGAFKSAHSISLERGATVTIINDDVMPHRLIKLAGAAATIRNGSTMPMGAGMHGTAAPGLMNYMGATTTIKLSTPGVYRFRTRAGEDYMPGFRTTGEDNVLTLTIIVA